MLALASIVLISSWSHVFGTPPKDPCIEALDPGPCKYFKVQWYWDPDEESCKKFHYGGCMGTTNRFGSKQQCLKQCIYKTHNPVAIPDLCLLPLDAGYCGDDRVGLWWWLVWLEIHPFFLIEC